MATVSERDEPTTREGEEPGRGRSALPYVLAVFGIFLASAVVYSVLGRRQEVPLWSPDEFLYGLLSRSVAEGNGLTVRGEPVDLRSSLLVYVLAPAWKTSSSLVDAYEMAKVVGAVMASAVVFPVWWLARRFLGPALALVPAVLSVAGVWTTVNAGIQTENLAYPLAAVGFAALVRYLSAPTARWGLITLGLAVIATFGRAQLVVLFPIIFASIAIDAGIRRTPWRQAFQEHRVVIVVSVAVTVLGVIAALASPRTVLGIYALLGSQMPSLGRLVNAVKDQVMALIVLPALIPLGILAAGSLRRDAWRSRDLAALLTVAWTASAVIVIVTAYHNADVEVKWSIERYLMYLMPPLLVGALALVDRRLVDARRFLVASVPLIALLLLAANLPIAGEERAQYALNLRVEQLIGGSPGVNLAVGAAVLAGLGALALYLTRRSSGRTAVLAVSVTIGAAALVLAQAGWDWQFKTADALRASFPRDLQWLDKTGTGPVARVVVTGNTPRWQITEFFNKDLNAVFVPDRPVGYRPIQGKTCLWTPDDAGSVSFAPGCGPIPGRVYLDDDFGKVTFHRQALDGQERDNGRVVTLTSRPPERPRIRSAIYLPCSPPLPSTGFDSAVRETRRFCFSTSVSGQFYLDEPAKMVMTWRGGTSDNQLQVGEKVYDIPAGKLTKVPLDVPAGNNPFQLQLPWSDPPPASPDLVSMTLTDGDGTTELLY